MICNSYGHLTVFTDLVNDQDTLSSMQTEEQNTLLALNHTKCSLLCPDNLPPIVFNKFKHILVRPLILILTNLCIAVSLLLFKRLARKNVSERTYFVLSGM